MLNRRQLRAKALQSLYAYHESRVANAELCQDKLLQNFDPSWEWEEKKSQDLELIKKQKEESKKLFKQYHNSKEVFRPNITIDDKVYRAVREQVVFFEGLDKKDRNYHAHELLAHTEKVYDAYLSALSLLCKFSDFAVLEKDAVERSYLRKTTEKGDFKLANNVLIQALRKNEGLQMQFIKRKISWENKINDLKIFYNQVIKNNADYIEYHQSLETDFQKDKEMILKMLKTFIFPRKTTNLFTLDEVGFPDKLWRNWLKNRTFEDIYEIINKKLSVVAQSFVNGLKDETKSNEWSQILVDKITLRFNKIVEVIKIEALKIQKYKISQEKQRERETAKALGQDKKPKFAPKNEEVKPEQKEVEDPLTQKNPKELLVKNTMVALVDVFSEFLTEQNLNLAGLQTQHIESINQTLSEFFTILNLNWDEKVRLVVRAKSDTELSYISDLLADNDLFWEESEEAVCSLVQKTIKSITEENMDTFSLMSLTKSWEDDKEFMLDLYKKSIEDEEEYLQYIAQNTQNWDVQRIAMIDRIILLMGISEMINCFSVPVKVTINEYIEMAKIYSTPKSKLFINGVLEAISKMLLDKNIIRKSALGLMDNK
ncbi:MAG: transcription antitermination factor NusB [Bacteroidetes bacterium]|nr:MAG: transcription antitermination factor NusB [Bacteroidota bacterium]TAG85331.1 MAG: transcription antitermination factor NusB [Bacteroidota bacterium]